MNLSLLFKMLGVKVTPDQIAAIEAIIPQIPGKVQEVITLVNRAVLNFDERLRAIEQRQQQIVEAVVLLREEIDGRSYNSSGDTAQPAGIGATERASNGR